MQVHQLPRQREPDAQAAVALQGTIHLREQLEDLAELSGRDPDSVIGDRDLEGHGIPDMSRELDPAARGRVLHRVAHQIPEHLDQARAVGQEAYRLFRQADVEGVSARLDLVAAGVDGRLGHLVEAQPLETELHQAACDARHVEEVVDQARHLIHLALDHLDRPPELRIGEISHPEIVRRVSHRAERVPELVRQDREEFVLPP